MRTAIENMFMFMHTNLTNDNEKDEVTKVNSIQTPIENNTVDTTEIVVQYNDLMMTDPKKEAALVTKTTNLSTTNHSGGSNNNSGKGRKSHHKAKIVTRIDFLEDNRKDMTLSRRLALKLMYRYKWYNPKLEGGERRDSTVGLGSLEESWAYFEHTTLPRYIVSETTDSESTSAGSSSLEKDGGETSSEKEKKIKFNLIMAEPGECYYKSKLYSPIFTPLKDMGAFGIGVGLYFSSLRAAAVITLIAGLISIPNIVYFNSSNYNNGSASVDNWILRGSAICTNQIWVPCPSCNIDDFSASELYRFGSSTIDSTLKFILKNNCNGPKFSTGIINYTTALFILVGILIYNYYANKMEVVFDDDDDTPQDYSIVVRNPPKDATDPEEWKSYFEEKFSNDQVDVKVSCCTVALNNEILLKWLVRRREIARTIKRIVLEPKFSHHEELKHAISESSKSSPSVIDLDLLKSKIDEIQSGRNCFQRLMARLIPGLPELTNQLLVLNTNIQEYIQNEKPVVTNVFLTFEKMAAQRHVLKNTDVPSVATMFGKNDVSYVSDDEKKYLFRDEYILNTIEAAEPSAVRWKDLDETWSQTFRQLFITFVSTFGIIVGIAVITKVVRDKSASSAAIVIAISNALFPFFAKILTSLEIHKTEGSRQTSLYVKITLFRWVNTAIVLTIISPFTSTIMEGKQHLLEAVYAIFFAELVTTNALQLLDIGGNFNRHFLAPRAKTQESMHLSMRGTEYFIAERYTNMTKMVFLTIWYFSIFPGALFLCSFILFINYYMDSFSLMRSWRPAPKIGEIISKYNRLYFYPLIMFMMFMVSGYNWSGFNFDNTCMSDSLVDDKYIGTWTVTDGDNTSSPISAIVNQNTQNFFFCLQDMIRFTNPRAFPAFPSFQRSGQRWMTSDQEKVTRLFGYTTIAMLAWVGLLLIIKISLSIWNIFHKTYKPRGKDNGKQFVEIQVRSGYIPEVASGMFPYPFVACEVDSLEDTDLFDWTDPYRDYKYYDLTGDVYSMVDDQEKARTCFSKVVYWHPQNNEKVHDC